MSFIVLTSLGVPYGLEFAFGWAGGITAPTILDLRALLG